MDSARDKVTDEIIDGESLWELHEVERDRYECHGCGVPLIPKSYEKGVNKKRPYFAMYPNKKHIDPCGVGGEEIYVPRAQTMSIGSPESFPVPFPSKLILTDERSVVAPHQDAPEPESNSRTKSASLPGMQNTSYHGHTVKTLRPICRTYMKFPHDHAHLPLAIPGCEGDRFASVFWRLGKIMRFRNPTHLFFGPLQWGAPHVGEAYIEWALDAGDWDAAARRRSPCYKVRVNWSHWTPRQRDTLRHELEVARTEVKGVSGGPKAWLFCVGTQDDTDPSLILVNQHRLICCLVGELRAPAAKRI